MNELDKLREMLTKAGITYENEQQPMTDLIDDYGWISERKKLYGESVNWSRNQVIYGRDGESWLWDGIWQYGSYGAEEGLIESYGELGVDDEHQPKVVTAEEAFAVIKADYDRRNNG